MKFLNVFIFSPSVNSTKLQTLSLLSIGQQALLAKLGGIIRGLP
jgi:hypothetical protein